MTTTYLELTALDPIVARDGRPFGIGQGFRMRGLSWPYPSVVAGSFRTAFGKDAQWEFTEANAKKLMAGEVAGILPVADGKLYLPAPSDCVVEETEQKQVVIHRAAPDEGILEGEAGCDWPDGVSLAPVLLDMDREFKPGDVPAWWPSGEFAEWITGKSVTFGPTFLNAAVSRSRDHVQLDADTGAAAESLLYSTAGLSLTHLPKIGARPDAPFHKKFAPVTLATRIRADGWPRHDFDTLHPLGGERRLVRWKAVADTGLWDCPKTVRDALATTNRVRMVLVTPAIFKHGWRPGWIDAKSLTGPPPGGVPSLKLVGASIPRWKAISGWSLAEPRGPKAIRRMVPAGGVYFFKTDGDARTLADEWLEPVSDDPQDRRDGFGLAAWGTW